MIFLKKIKRNSKIKNIILDPGIGFGKNLKHNLTLISKISLFHSVLAYQFWLEHLEKDLLMKYQENMIVKKRTGGTIASVLFLLSQGVQVFRVHNVREVKQGILIFKKFYLINEK